MLETMQAAQRWWSSWRTDTRGARRLRPLSSLALATVMALTALPARSVRSEPVGTAVFEDTIAQRLLACTACHGAQGRAAPDGYYPRIAGKPAGYLYHQLLNFREGRRHYRPMAEMVDPLDDAYLREIAEHFASLSLPYPPPAALRVGPEAQQVGERLVKAGDAARGLPACTDCHGRAMTGTEPHVPGLLGLPRDYLNAQLGAWRNGLRRAHAPDCMADIAKRLKDEEISAISGWLASQPVPVRSAAAPRQPGSAAEQRCGNPYGRGMRP